MWQCIDDLCVAGTSKDGMRAQSRLLDSPPSSFNSITDAACQKKGSSSAGANLSKWAHEAV